MREKSEILKEMGERIRERRLELMWTQEELATKAGYSKEAGRSSITRIEQGLVNIPAARIKRIAAALGVSEAYLLGLTDDREPVKKPEPQPAPPMQAVTIDSLEKLETDQLRRLMIYAEAILKAREIGGAPK